MRGTNGQPFDSASLTSNSLYTHAFGLPGRYEWRDSHGSGLAGEVVVSKPEGMESSAWLEALSTGTVVHISDKEATPATVEILHGQRVFWAIARAQGISITDVTLLNRPEDDAC